MIKLTTNEVTGLFALITSAKFKTEDIIIAEHELESNSLVLYLEDKNDFKKDLADCLTITVGIEQFKTFIQNGHHNQYRGRKESPEGSGKYYDAWVEISGPLVWYKEDATTQQKKDVRELLIKHIISEQVSNVQG